jgi:hypothetical protein
MAHLVRKNLIVDPDALRELARERGTSESEAVRHAIGQALAWYLMGNALEELHDMGAFADSERVEAMYGPLPSGEIDEPSTRSLRKPRSKRAS